jgi:hypothetical protein
MSRKPAPTILLLALALAQWHCIQTFVSPRTWVSGYLVVEGYITGNGPTWFHLSRSITLPGDSAFPAVTGAQLQVEGTDGAVYPFTETGNGYYLLSSVQLNMATAYRLRISQVNNETYLSNYVPYKPTPPIDSVNWVITNTGAVQIYATTHDPTGETKYYLWNYLETYEYTASEQSGYIYQGDTIAPRPPAEQIYTCYHTDSATDIILSSSNQLAQDVIYEQPILNIPANTQPLGIEYTILVSEYALTDSAYAFLSLMKANTEELGSIFGPMPTQLTGNIQSLTNPTEPVIGWVSAGTVQQQRIWISRAQLPAWLYFFECAAPDTVVPPYQPYLDYFFGHYEYVPVDILPSGALVANYATCIDCRLEPPTGTTQKPPFWP